MLGCFEESSEDIGTLAKRRGTKAQGKFRGRAAIERRVYNMKYAVIAIVVGIALLFGSLWLGIETGYRSANEITCVYQHGTMVLATKALTEMRNGDTNAIGTVQSLGFAAALYVLDSCSETIDTNLPSFKALLDYRRTYRTNSTEWTPAEQKLDRLLIERFN